ncbi:MAG: caspase family protein [Bacteroidota bacterium]
MKAPILESNFLKKFIFVLFITCLGNVLAQEVKLGLPTGHTGSLISAVFSSDGKMILTGSTDNTARLWDTKTGKLIYTLLGHSEAIISAEFNADGSKILTGSNDNTARIWDAKTGEQVVQLEETIYALKSVAFNADGSKILTTSWEKPPQLWDAKTGKLIITLIGHSEVVNSAVFNVHCSKILTASKDKTARIWDAETGQFEQSLPHDQELESAIFSNDNSKILTTSSDSNAFVWDIKIGRIITILKSTTKIVSSIFSPDNSKILSIQDDNSALIWDVKLGTIIHTLTGHTSFIENATFSADGQCILTASFDNSARLWNLKTGQIIHSFTGHSGPVTSAKFNSDDSEIVTGSFDGTARLWDVKTGKMIQIMGGHTNELRSAVFNSDQTNILSSGTSTFIWNVNTGKIIKSFENQVQDTYFSVYNESESKIYTGSYDDSIRIFDLTSGTQLHSFSSYFSYNFRCPERTWNDSKILTNHVFNEKSGVYLWNLKNGQLIKKLKGHDRPVESAIFNEDNTKILTSSSDKTACLFDAKRGKLIHKLVGHSESLQFAIFHPDNSKILTAALDSTIRLWDVNTGREIKSFSGVKNWYKSAVFSSDGATILTTSLHLSSQILNSKTGELIQTLELNGQRAESAIFSRDDSKILITTIDNTAQLWSSDQKGLFQYSKIFYHEGLLSAKFSPDESLIITTSADGSFIMWNTKTGEQLIRQFIFDANPNKWVHLHPSGLFDASPDAMELMYWTKGLEVIEFAQLKERYWEPGLWQKVMKGEPLKNVQGMNELKLQPEISFGEMVDGKIPVTLTQRDGGYGKVMVLINGKEIEGDARGENFNKSEVSQTIWVTLKDHPNLVDGENTIAVKAASEDGFVVSRPEEKKIQIKIPSNKPHLYAVVVGTGKYSNPDINLKYPEKDAKTISTALQIGAEGLFGKDKTHIYTLTTDTSVSNTLPGLRPSKTNIKNTFVEISTQAKSSDLIVVYLSGHGISWGGEQGDFYYITTDASASNAQSYNDEVIRKNQTISAAEFTDWLNLIPANKQVMIIDACASGKAVQNLKEERDIDGSAVKALDRMKDRTGMFVVSGSAADAVSYEAGRYGQGLLTYSILEAMKGAKLRDNSFFDVDLLLNYAREKVPEYAKGIGGIQVPQLLVPKGGSFDIGFVTDETKKEIPLSNVKPVVIRSLFVDSKKFNDHLGLSISIDNALNLLSNEIDAPFVFFDASEFPDAYQLSGGYKVDNGKYILFLTITKGISETSKEISANSVEELIEKIINETEKLK